MSPEPIPKFTPTAAKLWSAIGAENKLLLLANVWCVSCRHSVTIKNFTGVVKGGALLLVGQCAECQGDVARVVEAG